MVVATIESRVDPHTGFTLHDVEIGQWVNGENIKRMFERRPAVKCHAMSTTKDMDRISTRIIYE